MGNRRGWPVAQVPQPGQVRQAAEDGILVNAKINQAGHLVHADAFELVEHRQTAFRRAQQTVASEVAVKAALRPRLEVFPGNAFEIKSVAHPMVGQASEKVGRGFQIITEGPADGFADASQVGSHEGMHHERHPALALVMFRPGGAISPDFSSQVLKILAQQMREQVRAEPLRLCGRSPGGRRW